MQLLNLNIKIDLRIKFILRIDWERDIYIWSIDIEIDEEIGFKNGFEF